MNNDHNLEMRDLNNPTKERDIREVFVLIGIANLFDVYAVTLHFRISAYQKCSMLVLLLSTYNPH